ncbi:hypothetical protein PPERSA_04279 [Pseudocohnilembus persalinus]|uniref:SAC domain-containing protein n=1 Tax=Pseudocohnilembus persalinus TaxID=266149 RepID=A0A0V0QNA8_PSEPJ|nr:hypothetical protein PPERSA_04279 [Pseudocohnilembus persalinus]|eukprot:KRX03771.1 hypothetical protein PPERSA_04279 [Pseudocohnilembus persalinus]
MEKAQKNINNDIEEYLDEIRKILEENHYFSYTYELSHKFRLEQTKSSEESHFFAQNYAILEHFRLFNVSKHWQIIVIKGYIGYINHTFSENKSIKYYLITRKSNKRYGTRYNHRGVDGWGNVANYCETEQIVVTSKKIYSHILVRGSVPLFWQQSQQKDVDFTKGKEMQKEGMQKHFNAMLKQYEKIICVNLMKLKNNQLEKKLGEQFKYFLDQLDINQVGYLIFDFSNNKSSVNLQIESVMDPLIREQQFDTYDIKNNIFISQQQSVFRINCKDCLDRTNNYMMKLAIFQLDLILQFNFGNNFKNEWNNQQIMYALDASNEKNTAFLKQFKVQWSIMGDHISTIYAGNTIQTGFKEQLLFLLKGTQATTTKLTLHGSQSLVSKKIDDAMITFKRIIQSHFSDPKKQEALKILQNSHYSQKYKEIKIKDPQIENMIEDRKNEYLKQK